MIVTHSHIIGAVDSVNAFKAAIFECFTSDVHDYVLENATKNPSCDVRYELADGSVLYVYPVGSGYYRIDFTCEAKK